MATAGYTDHDCEEVGSGYQQWRMGDYVINMSKRCRNKRPEAGLMFYDTLRTWRSRSSDCFSDSFVALVPDCTVKQEDYL